MIIKKIVYENMLKFKININFKHNSMLYFAKGIIDKMLYRIYLYLYKIIKNINNIKIVFID